MFHDLISYSSPTNQRSRQRLAVNRGIIYIIKAQPQLPSSFKHHTGTTWITKADIHHSSASDSTPHRQRYHQYSPAVVQAMQSRQASELPSMHPFEVHRSRKVVLSHLQSPYSAAVADSVRCMAVKQRTEPPCCPLCLEKEVRSSDLSAREYCKAGCSRMDYSWRNSDYSRRL